MCSTCQLPQGIAVLQQQQAQQERTRIPSAGASDRRAPRQKDEAEEPELTMGESVLARAMGEEKPHAGALASGWANRARLKTAERLAATKAEEAAKKAAEAEREAPKLS